MSSRTRLERGVAATLVGTCLGLILTQGVVLLRTFHGDPNIYLIYARNIADGDPFSFNPGEFSSGSTGPLWAVVLSVAFLLPWSVLAAKCIGIAATMLAYGLTFRAGHKLSGSPVAGALAAGVVTWVGAFYGLMLFETALIQCCAALALASTTDLLRDPATRTTGRLALLAIVWGAALTTRPDSVVLVLSNVAAVGYGLRDDRAAVRKLLPLTVAAFVPATLYFGYSYAVTGHLCVSATCRGFAVQESAPRMAGVAYSLAALRTMMRPAVLILAGFALWAAGRRVSRRSHRVLMVWLASVIVGYLAILTLVVPTTFGVERYLVPALTLLAAAGALGMRDLVSAAFHGRHRWGVVALGVLLLALPALGFLRTGARERAKDYDFETIMERDLTRRLNSIVPRGATVLAYEVQMRFDLRPDIRLLSLDGITDGAVAPFLDNGDLRSFLWRYKPAYWVANDAVSYRPYLADSLLRRVVDSAGAYEGAAVEVEGIRFTNLRVNREPRIPGFAGYRQLFALEFSGALDPRSR